MTVQPTRDQLREDAERHLGLGGGGDDLANGVLTLLDQLDQQEQELDSWMTRAYEAEQRARRAEVRINAVADVLDTTILRDGAEERELAHRIRRALEG